MNKQDIHLFHLHAQYCQTIANPKRLMIIALLNRREMSVGELVKAMHARLSNVSQHLRVLRAHHVVTTRKEGKTVFYRLTDPRLHQIGVKLRQILLSNLERGSQLPRKQNSKT